ncbi:MAG: glycosyltransferase family 4 protein [Nostoc sp. TH1S01]|nr:glycosyltransferase family 4 protein [Nostoc sp. TH1S01]
MRLGIKFSPPNKIKSGSAYTFATNLIPILYQKNPDLRIFTASPQIFSEIAGSLVHYTANPFWQASPTKKIASWLHQQVTLENQLIQEKVDVLYCPFNYESLFLTYKIPQVITVHDLIPLIWQQDFKATSTLWKYLYIPAIKNAKAIITESENTKKDILRFCNISPEKIFVIPIGYTFKEVSAAEVSYKKDPYILYVCSTHYPYKNLFKLFEAYHAIHNNFPHKLVIVGKSIARFTPQIKTKISELGLSEKIVLRENLSDTDLAIIYQNADLFVYPSLYEGFGIPPLEAMSYGIPVVASNVASIPEVCGDAALYIEPHSVDSIADGMIRGLSDSDLRQKLKIAGRERVKLFNWETTAERILEVCQIVSN